MLCVKTQHKSGPVKLCHLVFVGMLHMHLIVTHILKVNGSSQNVNVRWSF